MAKEGVDNRVHDDDDTTEFLCFVLVFNGAPLNGTESEVEEEEVVEEESWGAMMSTKVEFDRRFPVIKDINTIGVKVGTTRTTR